MPCYHPLQAWRAAERSLSGKVKIYWSVPDAAFPYFPIQLPCGQCVGCRLERSRQWAMRCVHESKLYENNSFITLTYSDEWLPPFGLLMPDHFTKFMKRLRKKFKSTKIRYFHCGEYGDRYGRPHFHACLFNCGFPDKRLFKTDNGINLYDSEILKRLWPLGFSSIGDVTFESAAYVARYVMKKINGDDAPNHYGHIDFDTGEFTHSAYPKEYTTMSRKPGIGKRWIDEFMHDTYKDDTVILRGAKMRPSRYYDSQLESFDASRLLKIKSERKFKAMEFSDDQTPERLVVREKVQLAKLQFLKRSVE